MTLPIEIEVVADDITTIYVTETETVFLVPTNLVVELSRRSIGKSEITTSSPVSLSRSVTLTIGIAVAFVALMILCSVLWYGCHNRKSKKTVEHNICREWILESPIGNKERQEYIRAPEKVYEKVYNELTEEKFPPVELQSDSPAKTPSRLRIKSQSILNPFNYSSQDTPEKMQLKNFKLGRNREDPN